MAEPFAIVSVNEEIPTTSFTTTESLDDGKTYTSILIDLTTHTQVQTEINASHDGMATFLFYSDSAGLDLVRTLTVPYVAASGFQLLAAPTFGYYVKYQFLNDSGSNQTDFYFTTKLLHTSLSAQVLSLGGKASDAMTSSLIRIGNDHTLDLSRGLLVNQSVVHKFGGNDAVGTAEVNVSLNGVMGFPTAASTVSVISDDTDDDAGEAGALTVEITGIDSNFDEISEILTCNGTTASTVSTNSYWRIYRARVMTSGTTQSSNIGTLTVSYTGNGDALEISPQVGSSETTHFVVPRNKTGYITRLHTSVDGKKTADLSFWIQPNFDTVAAPFSGRRMLSKIIGLGGSDEILFDSYLRVPAMSEIYMTAIAAATNTGVNAHFDIVLVDD